MQQNAFEIVVCKMVAILSWPPCVNSLAMVKNERLFDFLSKAFPVKRNWDEMFLKVLRGKKFTLVQVIFK